MKKNTNKSLAGNIFELYGQLNMSGQRTAAQKFISEVFGVSTGTVKNHWILSKEFPTYVLEDHKSKLNEVVRYLQKQIALNNKAVIN